MFNQKLKLFPTAVRFWVALLSNRNSSFPDPTTLSQTIEVRAAGSKMRNPI
jgi:hypothetical protein